MIHDKYKLKIKEGSAVQGTTTRLKVKRTVQTNKRTHVTCHNAKSFSVLRNDLTSLGVAMLDELQPEVERRSATSLDILPGLLAAFVEKHQRQADEMTLSMIKSLN